MGLLLVRQLASNPPRLIWVRGPLVGAWAVAFAGGVAVLAGESMSAAGGLSPVGIATYLSCGEPGYARLLRLGFEAAALILAMLGIRGVTVLVLAAITALAAAGHAAALRPAAPAIAVDAIHLASAGLWAGGILALAAIRGSGDWRSSESRVLLKRFTPVGLIAFSLTALTGLLQAVEELSSPLDLIQSTYGNVLAFKLVAVGAMLPLSLVAWRRLRPRPRLEAAIILVVVSASALLAAFPLPPARLAEAEARPASPGSALPLPQPRHLTLGGSAGDSVVGLTIRPRKPGPNTLWVYALPVSGEAAAAQRAVRIQVDGRDLSARRCGPTCATAPPSPTSGESISVLLGPPHDAAGFKLPRLPRPDGTAVVQTLQRAMHQLSDYRIDETLGPAMQPLRTLYAFQSPDRLSYQLSTGGAPGVIGTGRDARSTPSQR